MKKSLLVLLFGLFACLQVQGQFWFDISAKGGWGPTFLFHENIFDDATVKHKFSSGAMFGGKLGLNFGDRHAINLDVEMGKFSQKFDRSGFDSILTGLINEYTNVSYTGLNLSLLYRKIDRGRYLEIGPSMVRISNDERFNSSNWGAVFGFGRALAGNDRFALNIGMRFRYVIDDINSPLAAIQHYPGDEIYPEYKGSHPLTMAMYLELDWAVGTWGTSSCYKRRKFVFF